MTEITSAIPQEQNMARLIIKRFFKHRLAGFAIATIVRLNSFFGICIPESLRSNTTGTCQQLSKTECTTLVWDG